MDKTIQLLNDAHDMLHRLLCVFVPDIDAASTKTSDLMQRIREHLGDEFDGRGSIAPCPECGGSGENRTLTGCCARCGGRGELGQQSGQCDQDRERLISAVLAMWRQLNLAVGKETGRGWSWGFLTSEASWAESLRYGDQEAGE